jgi:hypothetical protein
MILIRNLKDENNIVKKKNRGKTILGRVYSRLNSLRKPRRDCRTQTGQYEGVRCMRNEMMIKEFSGLALMVVLFLD